MQSVSVVICAHTERRWGDTLAAVASVRSQSQPPKEVIVVVDHNRSLYERLKSVLADAIVVENREQHGLSGGKNTGVATASGRVVAFLDDDAIADANWLKFLVDSYDQPGVVGVGGLTLPMWDTERPAWFPAEFDWVVGCMYVGMPTHRTRVRNLMGGNASFKRDIFKQVGGFRSGIGRGRGKLPMGCEDTEFCIRLTQQVPGTVLLFDNRATIWHRVPAERCRFAYYWSRCYAEGLSKAMVTRSVGTNDGLASERHYTTRTLPRGVVSGLAETVHGDGTGLSRAGAIIAGLASASAGYTVGMLSGSQSGARIPVGVRRLWSGGEQRGSDHGATA
jgi:GT2 family glycosyltransferase